MKSTELNHADWQRMAVPVDEVLHRIRPGMRIFLGTGLAEPQSFVQALMNATANNLLDLELIQLVSLSKAISPVAAKSSKLRLKTFFPGPTGEPHLAVEGYDLIPGRFGRITALFASGRISVDVAVLQITPPDPSGYCSLGVSLDVGRMALAQSSIAVGEINPQAPHTYGDTLIQVSEFDLLIEGDHSLPNLARPSVDDIQDLIGAHLASLIEEGSCLAFSYGPLYDALVKHLSHHRHLGIHTPFFTDACMDLVRSGAVTNRRKGVFHGRSVASYAIGTAEMMQWLGHNPLVEFQAIDQVFNPAVIGCNPNFVAVYPAQTVDLTGRVTLKTNEGYPGTGAAEVYDFCGGAEISRNGRSIFALPSLDDRRHSNIKLDVECCRNQYGPKGSIDMVVTEYGTADIQGRSVRERAQAIIDIAHPDVRDDLVRQAKAQHILYADQIFLSGSARLYPGHINVRAEFKNGIEVRFRAIRPSDEEGMRRLFYRFSDEGVYYRYFTPLRSMPHRRMQTYVNVDWQRDMSIVGLVGPPGQGTLVAEGRYCGNLQGLMADLVFVVDPRYQGIGLASYLYRFLTKLAQEKGLKGFTADVLFSNQAMMKVFRRGGLPLHAKLEQGIYYLTIPFESKS
jgi:acyl-CoA hydrolase/GNAT superfamily N-acetyltransferase